MSQAKASPRSSLSAQKLGFRTGQHVLLQARIDGSQVVRPYAPVTLSDQRGSFDLMVKVYPAGGNEFRYGGLMSQFLDRMNRGDTVQAIRTRFVYCANVLPLTDLRIPLVPAKLTQVATLLDHLALLAHIQWALELSHNCDSVLD
ncbi:hypothetical protein HPB48_022329 [Haemaphysalis longicornis]|uniref:FAD-binding FR-type domain-containing protein n=1 Tax=Haemaphysalis longicornis TaxID=44386 RepID=A0A9J6H684_HAELO|nr:hypothetical protein HPB48_022329 [Haemaphysalis longicornis]